MKTDAENGGAPLALPKLDDTPGIDPITGLKTGTPSLDPSAVGVVFPEFDEELSPWGAHIVRKDDLWWSARCEWRDGSEEKGMYGVLVTCRDRFGNQVAYRRGRFIYPRKMAGASKHLWVEANRIASDDEGDAQRRAAHGLAVRAVPSGAVSREVVLVEEPGVDEYGRRRAGNRRLVEPVRRSFSPVGRQARPNDPVVVHRARRGEAGLSADVSRVVDSVKDAVREGGET